MTDLQILHQIEKQLGVSFERVDFTMQFDLHIHEKYTEYVINPENDIVGLTIKDFKITDLTQIGKLKQLKTLHLINNEIKQISRLNNLKRINWLVLQNNSISDISALKDLKKITALFLDNNQIKDISVLGNLEKLETLSLFDNKINDISSLSNLKQITTLLISGNEINDISPVKLLFKNKKINFELGNNPLKFPPKEIVKLGTEAINEYFEHAANGTSILREAKLIIIGESGAGKTTFARKIQNPKSEMPKPEDTTLGIDVFSWNFDAEYSSDYSDQYSTGYNAKLWDFGGQDIYHGTHQFFFSDKSLYVLLADTREQKTDFNYWLNTVEQLTGKDSPLVILLNRKQKHTWQIDEPGLKNRFGDIIRKVITIDLSQSSEILILQNIIKEQITNLPHIGYTLPTSWVKIRLSLSKIEDKFISFEKFKEICKETGITNPRVVEIISKLFSNIGVFTYFSDETSGLQDIIFLDSNWLTKTVYLLLNSEAVKSKKGRINLQEIKEIWGADELYFEITKFIELLKKFSLIYKINGSNNYIVPEHLPMIQPYENWEHTNENNIYQFRYLFDNYMPKGIMAKLIVALHQYIFDNKLAWHRGVNISNSIINPDTYAEIIETYGRENRFDIRIYGKNQKDLLQLIIYHFDRILKPIKKLTHEKLVPCNCDTCKLSSSPHFYHYTELLERKENNKITIECRKTPYLDINIKELIDGINYTELRSLLINEKFAEFEKLIFQRFSDISYQIHKEKVSESFFHSVLHTILAENGLNPISEESTNDGRIDLHLTIGQTKYLFELKIDQTAENALEQIHQKGYYKKYQRGFKKIILIGINFSSKKRNITGIKTTSLRI